MISADDTPLGLRGDFMGVPGVIVKNSEVGYSSLYLMPFLLLETRGKLRPIAFVSKTLLRKVHRGSVADLRKSFEEELGRLKDVWGPIKDKMNGLRNITYKTEDDAVNAMRRELTALRSTKASMLAYENAYRAMKLTVHDGLSILQAVLTTTRATTADASYDEAELAGALLLRLL